MEKIKSNHMNSNERGITLVEILSALAILSTVLLLAGSIQFFSQKQMNNQKTEIQNQSNVRLVSNLLTKDIRRAVDVTVNSNSDFIITNADTSKDKYTYNNNILYKNDQPLITNLGTFAITKNAAENSISLTIADLPNTTIFIRK